MKARSERPSPKRSPQFFHSRARLLLLVLVFMVGTLATSGTVLTLASSFQDRQDLKETLAQSTLACRSTRSRDLDQLSQQADLVAHDPRLRQYLEALALAPADSPERGTLEGSLRSHLLEVFQAAGGDALLLIGPNGRVQLAVEHPLPTQRGVGVEPSEATTPAEGAAGSQEPSPELPSAGQNLENPLVDAVFGDGQARSGCVRLSPTGPLYDAAVTPLRKEKRVDGVLLLVEEVTEKTLAEWGQGLSDGVVLAVADGKIVAAHDRRASRRPSPSLLNSLEMAVSRWAPEPGTERAQGEDRDLSSPGTLKIGGRDWLEYSVSLGSGDSKPPTGWILFLGDTSTLEYRVDRQIWLMGKLGLGALSVGLLLAWLLAGWVLAPLEKIS